MGSVNNSLDNCDGIKLVALSASISALLAEYLNLDDQNVIGNVLCGIGQNLLIIAAQTSKNQNCLQARDDKNIFES
ncbi:MAG: hypothetical protein PHD15_00825 [Clostridia bacterium]|nr:hypothetical protein [Clostridia bacterium]MDD4386294.1 hypothetical protein [Clostridia bacterium]